MTNMDYKFISEKRLREAMKTIDMASEMSLDLAVDILLSSTEDLSVLGREQRLAVDRLVGFVSHVLEEL